MARNNTVVRIEYNRFAQIARQMPDAAMEAVEDTLIDIDRDVQIGMAAGGTGRIYIRRHRTHQASSPGEMPAKDLANLAASMQSEIDRVRRKGYYYTTADYAPHLEYGTRYMAARPFMTPSAEAARAAFLRRMRRLEERLR